MQLSQEEIKDLCSNFAPQVFERAARIWAQLNSLDDSGLLDGTDHADFTEKLLSDLQGLADLFLTLHRALCS